MIRVFIIVVAVAIIFATAIFKNIIQSREDGIDENDDNR